MSTANNNDSEANLPESAPEAAPQQPAIGFEPLDELLAHSKIFSDYVAALASEE